MTTYDQALEIFLGTRNSFGGGLSNHGPMASEALVSLGQESRVGEFVAAYLPRLETRSNTDPISATPGDWRGWLSGALTNLVPHVEAAAGHGLLRVAHAIRGVERAEAEGDVPAVRLAELAAAVDYWESVGPGLLGPSQLEGPLSAAEWADQLPRLDPDSRPEGLLTQTLAIAAGQPSFRGSVASLTPGTNAQGTFDQLAIASATKFLNNEGLSAFALLHGTTVSNMSRSLLPYLSDEDTRRLEAAVAGFVAAAIIGFDVRATSISKNANTLLDFDSLDSAALPANAAATLDDHTIKFTDTCLSVGHRTNSSVMLLAAQRQIADTSSSAN